MISQTWLALMVALGFAAVHAYGVRLSFLPVVPRSAWLSAAGGISVAYVFVHLLPELHSHQREVGRKVGEELGRGSWLTALESHVYVIALAGLTLFYGLERLAKISGRRATATGEKRTSDEVFWLHMISYAAYNLLIGYLLLHREEQDLRSLLFYAGALGVHFLVNDHALRADHGDAYHRTGRWILAVAPIAGWGLGALTTISSLAVAALFAFLAGGIVLNVLKEELPEDRESRFWAFAGGVVLYTLLLTLTQGASPAQGN